MPSCTLEIGGLLVARAEGGAFEVEYALFEAHEIELRSNNEPGTVREHGYETTVELARERLEAQGATRALAEAVAGEMGALVTTYARGPEVRRVASLLQACELFDGHTWNAEAKRYEGGWLDVAALAADTGIDGAARALQALHLAALLHDAKGDATVFLGTASYSSGRKAGARSHRRVSLESVTQIEEAIRTLSEARSSRATREGGPTRAELLESVRTRLALCVNDRARAKLETLQRTLNMRERPQRGPLADADLWAVELQLDEGDTSDAAERLDAVERSRGRAPGSTYLRARLALMVGSEAPRALAERVSALALSMSAFPELELLVAEAWTKAGDPKRAGAYARVLVDNPQLESAIRERARTMLVDTGTMGGERAASVAPPASARATRESHAVAKSSAPPASTSSLPRAPESSAPALVAITTSARASFIPPKGSSAPPVTISEPVPEPESDPFDQETRETPVQSTPPEALDPDTRETPIQPVPILSRRPPAASAPPPRAAVPANSAYPVPDAPPTAPSILDEHLESRHAPTRPSMRAPSPAAYSVRPAVVRDDEESEAPAPYAAGGSQPPFRTEPPPLDFPAEPIVPRADGVERVETLSLPADVEDVDISARPTTPREARIHYTLMARDLGHMYRTRFNVELRTDLRSIEIVQRHLAERFEDASLTSVADLKEVHMHGAFLSEVLARRLGAEWVDLAVSEPGYRAMNVPPGTRVWPIGRVIRFVTMQHRERDLVSYFLELQARAHGVR